jgi:hypothetical protein
MKLRARLGTLHALSANHMALIHQPGNPMDTKKMRRMNAVFYALLAQAAAVHGAAAQAPADTTSSSVKPETIDSKPVSDAVAVA